MSTAKKHDWFLIIMGVLLLLMGVVFMLSPAETLVTLTICVGAFLLIAGIFDIVSYFRFRDIVHGSGWIVAYGILDIILGLMFLFQPIALAGVIPWVVGLFVLIFGIYEIIAAFRVKKTGLSLWGWVLFSGITGIVLGLCFFFFPLSFVLYIALFLFLRGVSLVVYGWNTTTINWL